ncbi:D-sedoheptulose-7-phosphate isomerase [Aquicella lusitana]|uniref:D-sedoheptulose 7-phosphate isomerase n=1 Tax=Aquicella lusitana TaxID=254246 RepID=A0A370GP86_9COXI|nr:SIS domain-containing protein [Aquicella lusitana]RDI45130.1 D-sedoheptulose 7-phosphate isomerase [Aquicella lusitana]VVC72800.1 Phosphoheptose isomerase [Aquicella lusitana]
MLDWIKNHFNTLHNLQLNTIITDQEGKQLSLDEGFRRYIRSVKAVRQLNSKLIFIGNGGSAGIASHLAIDYSKNGRMPAMAFSDASAITCLSNDYGYEHVFAKQIEFHGRQGDIVIAISSSGKSINILNAVAAARSLGCQVITFSGFTANNPLSHLGDLNFYVDSNEYGFVEVAHIGLGHAMLDYIIEEQSSGMETRNTLLAAVE